MQFAGPELLPCLCPWHLSICKQIAHDSPSSPACKWLCKPEKFHAKSLICILKYAPLSTTHPKTSLNPVAKGCGCCQRCKEVPGHRRAQDELVPAEISRTQPPGRAGRMFCLPIPTAFYSTFLICTHRARGRILRDIPWPWAKHKTSKPSPGFFSCLPSWAKSRILQKFFFVIQARKEGKSPRMKPNLK